MGNVANEYGGSIGECLRWGSEGDERRIDAYAKTREIHVEMPIITSETARILGARGNAIRWSQPRHPKNPPNEPATVPKLAEPIADQYLTRRLNRVRDQIDLVSDRLDSEIDRNKVDATCVDRLAAALERLCDLERTLAQRPLPGSMRPSPAPTRRQSQAYTAPMIEDDVAPTPAPAVTKPKPYDGPETG